MAQRVQTRLTCDLDEDEVEAVETATFAADGQTYAFELCEAHLEEFIDTMTAWTSAARVVSERRGQLRRRLPEDLGAIRTWARANGYEVSGRGRVPAGLRAEYNEAMAGAQLIREVEADIAAQPSQGSGAALTKGRPKRVRTRAG